MPTRHRPRWAVGGVALNSLRVQLILWIALPVVVSLLAMSLMEIRGHEQAMTRMVQQQTDLVARSLGVLIDAHIDQRQGILLQLSGDQAAQSQTIQTIVAPQQTFAAGVWVAGASTPDGTAAPPAWAENEAVSALIDEVAATQRPGLATIHDPTNEQWLLVQAVPMPGTSGASGRVLVGAEPVAALITEHLIASLDPALIDEMRLTTAGGEVLYTQRGEGANSEPEGALGSHSGHGLARWVMGQTTILPTNWQVTVYKDWRDLVPPVLTFGNTALVIVGLATLLSLLAAYFGLSNIVWPLHRLVQAAGRVGWGDFAAIHQPVGGVAEIEELRMALARMTEQIRQYQQELQSYIGAMTLGQEEERRRLARELHDATVQDLIALNQQVEMVTRELGQNSERAATRLHELRPQVTAIIDGLRRQIHALRPLYLEDLGFLPAIEMLVRQVGQRHHLQAHFAVSGDAEIEPAMPIQISAFRIAQEALQNVVQHAHASRVDLTLHLAADALSLEITDDGRGFAVPDRPYHLAQEGHFGLLGMKERAQLHSGTLEIKSQNGRGTVVLARLPLHDATPHPSATALSQDGWQ